MNLIALSRSRFNSLVRFLRVHLFKGLGRCPVCGSFDDAWFSRSEPMGYYCPECGHDYV